MELLNIADASFRKYGRILTEYDVQPILKAMKNTPLPESGTAYVPEDASLQELETCRKLGMSLYGGLPAEFGWCNGFNTKLNCLEYHRSSEFDLCAEDLVLLLAKEEEIANGRLHTDRVKAFWCPAGTFVELYATTLHFAPCQAHRNRGFRMMVALPAGTNTEKPVLQPETAEDERLFAANKWLLAHPESAEAQAGAYIGLEGENPDIAPLLH